MLHISGTSSFLMTKLLISLQRTHTARCFMLRNEPVGAFLLRGAGYCLMTSDLVPPCAEQALNHFDTIAIAVDSHFLNVPDVDIVLREISEHRTLRTKARFGYDRWASLKSLLTRTRLDPWILTVEIYR